jgi:glycosyltransferase involved in cell wall biosynthesis
MVPRLLTRPLIAIYRRADAFACISHGLEREALAGGVPADRIHFLPNAVDTTRFRPASADERRAARDKLGLSQDAVVCLFVGRLSREKGLMELMEAWRLIQPSAAILVVAGPDMVDHPWNVGPAAREFATRHNLDGSVRFLGSIADVASLLRVADVFVQPSHFEALGLSAVEALAAGVPVIASAVGGLVELIADGRNGKLCPPKAPAELAACLRTLIEVGALRQQMSARARPSVADEYDERVVFARFATLRASWRNPL